MLEQVGYDSLPKDVREIVETANFLEGDEAIASLQAVVARYPGCVLARLNLAATQLRMENLDSAEREYTSILTDFPGETKAVGGLATVAAARKDFLVAEQHAKNAIEAGYD